MSLVVGAYVVDAERVRDELRRLGVRSLLIQSPLGLRAVAAELAKILEAEGYVTVLSNSSCWGACDVAYHEADALGVDVILHLGHTPFLRRDKKPTIYIPCTYWDPSPILDMVPKLADTLRGFGRVGLGASVQWITHVELLRRKLGELGVDTLTHEPRMFAREEAQVLGCDYTSLKPLEEKVGAYLIIGSIFHALGMALLTEKPTYAADPTTQSIKELTETKKKILNQRYAQISRFQRASRIGVIVSIKPGQKRTNIASLIAKILSNNGKEAYVISADEVNEYLMLEYGFDAYVNTACPRLSIEDQVRFPKPLLLPVEALVAVGVLDWGYVIEKGLLMFPWGYVGEEAKLLWRIIADEAGRKEKALRT